MKVLITGAAGLVGRALTAHCVASQDEVFSYDRASLDIADPDRVRSVITKDGPDVVINCAAWTDVDGCERDPTRSDAVNAQGPQNLARAARSVGASLITISTDYVFDGLKEGFFTQRDDPNPLSVYGRSKLQGERRAQSECARTVVVRSGFIFGSGGKNFLSTLIGRVRQGEQPKAIDDAWGTPTYASDLAVRLRELALLDMPGIFHVVSTGEGASYATFAREALTRAGLDTNKLEVISSKSLTRPAPRPTNSRLKCLLSGALGLQPLPTWQDGLARYINDINQKHTQTSQIAG